MEKIFLVLQSRLMREGLRKLLCDAGFQVVAEASTVDDALQLSELHPDQEISLTILEGSLCRKHEGLLSSIRHALPKSRLTILATGDDLLYLKHEHIMAADCILSLDISGEIMMQSLRLLQLGQRVMPMELVMLLFTSMTVGVTPPKPVPAALDDQIPVGKQSLSQREVEILRYLVDGCSNKLIARRLGITEATVKVHLKGVLRKVRAANRTQAAIWALNNGITGLASAPGNGGGLDRLITSPESAEPELDASDIVVSKTPTRIKRVAAAAEHAPPPADPAIVPAPLSLSDAGAAYTPVPLP